MYVAVARPTDEDAEVRDVSRILRKVVRMD
jgi:hypothetical protein